MLENQRVDVQHKTESLVSFKGAPGKELVSGLRDNGESQGSKQVFETAISIIDSC